MRKRLSMLLLGAILSFGVSKNAFAEMPDMSVVIGDKGFSLSYANKADNSGEIVKALQNAKGEVYVKVNGQWVDNYGDKIDKSSIREVEYVDENGMVLYEEHDGALKNGAKAVKEEEQETVQNKKPDLYKLIKAGKYKATLMDVVIPDDVQKEVDRLEAKLQEVSDRDPDFYISFFQKKFDENGVMKSEEEVPWDDRIGITREEFDYLDAAGQKNEMKEYGTTEIEMVDLGEGKIVIKDNEYLDIVYDMIIDTLNNQVDTRFDLPGDGDILNLLDEDEIVKNIGDVEWTGGTWGKDYGILEDIDQIDYNRIYGKIMVTIGKIKDTNKTIIFYYDNIIAYGNPLNRYEIIVIE